MMSTSGRLAALALTSVMLTGVAVSEAAAQPPVGQRAGAAARGANAGGADQGPAPLTPAETQKLFDSYVLVQARGALGLTDAQFPGFVTRLMALQEARRRNQQARRRVLMTLAQMTGPQAAVPVDEAKIREQVKALSDLDARTSDEVHRAQDALDQVLDVRQQGRFRVFEDQVERRMLDLMLSARRSAAAQAAAKK
jgi:hypothetical protein